MVKKLSICLVFALMLPYSPVLCQDNEWQNLLDQAQEYGIDQGTVAEAQSVLGDSSMEQVAEAAFRDGSLADWVIEASADATTPPPTESSGGLPSDIANSPTETPNLAPTFPLNAGPELAPNNAPLSAPSPAPLSAPSPAPYAAPPQA